MADGGIILLDEYDAYKDLIKWPGTKKLSIDFAKKKMSYFNHIRLEEIIS